MESERRFIRREALRRRREDEGGGEEERGVLVEDEGRTSVHERARWSQGSD
jgi:hypothetical protein